MTRPVKIPAAQIINIHPAGLHPGLSKFTAWRDSQQQMIADAYLTEKRFIFSCAPVGIGKSLYALALSILTGKRTAILTHSRGLQDQYFVDGEPLGMVDIRGKSNYGCIQYEGMTCEEATGACRAFDLCTYRQQISRARQANLVIANFSAWIYQHLYGTGLGEFDLLIIDEAHGITEELCKALAASVLRSDLYTYLQRSRPPEPSTSLHTWVTFSRSVLPGLIIAQETLEEEMKTSEHRITHEQAKYYRGLRRLVHALKVVSTATADNWVCYEERNPQRWTIEPIWPKHHAERALFLNIPKVVLMSATLVPKLRDLLGCDPGDTAYFEYPYVFDTRRSPVYVMPVARMDFRNREMGDALLINFLHAFLKARTDRKGIIHSVSYDRARFIAANLDDYYRIITHESGGVSEAIQQFSQPIRLDNKGMCLVSPAITTGYSFPYNAAEYQVIPKVPFPDARHPALEARQKQDKEYTKYLTATSIAQMVGRTMRAPDDRCETVIADAHFRWVMEAKKGFPHLFPKWFSRLLCWVSAVPTPPQPLKLSNRNLSAAPETDDE